MCVSVPRIMAVISCTIHCLKRSNDAFLLQRLFQRKVDAAIIKEVKISQHCFKALVIADPYQYCKDFLQSENGQAVIPQNAAVVRGMNLEEVCKLLALKKAQFIPDFFESQATWTKFVPLHMGHGCFPFCTPGCIMYIGLRAIYARHI